MTKGQTAYIKANEFMVSDRLILNLDIDSS
jgi:hypothetical protein